MRETRATAFDRIYGIFVGRDVLRDARAVVAASAARYLDMLTLSDGGRDAHPDRR